MGTDKGDGGMWLLGAGAHLAAGFGDNLGRAAVPLPVQLLCPECNPVKTLRGMTPGGGAVNPDSGWYRGGEWAGRAWQAAFGGAAGAAASGASRAAGGAGEAAAAGDIAVIGKMDVTGYFRGAAGRDVLSRIGWGEEVNVNWVREIIARRAAVQLASPITPTNMVDEATGGLSWFGREVTTLLEAGYTQWGNWLVPPL